MVKGVDTSHWQGDRGAIDWVKVKASGYLFAFLKATQGVNFKDGQYGKDKEAARTAGVLVGHYHFANGGNAVAEADFFLSVVGEIKEGECLILDWEIQHATTVAWCKEWLDHVTEKVGFKPILYLNESTVLKEDWTPVVKGGYGLWEAKYGDNDTIPEPNEIPSTDEWPFFAIWQFSSKGSVPGIIGNVDINQANFESIDTLKKYGKPKSSELEPGKSKVEPVLRDALKFAYNVEIGDFIDPQDQVLIAESIVALKKSEMVAVEKLQKIKSII